MVLVPVYWAQRGPANFLWASDIALLVTVGALWRESRFLSSMMAVAVLLPELGWNVDFFLRLGVAQGLMSQGWSPLSCRPRPERAGASIGCMAPTCPWLSR